MECFKVFRGPFWNKWPGHLMLVYNEHIIEQSDIERNKQARVFLQILSVESAMRHTLRPSRINFAKFGNASPHLHWHLIPRFSSERYPSLSPWELLSKDDLYVAPNETHQNLERVLADSIAKTLALEM